MPTGYTYPIYEGRRDFTLADFAIRCARDFGFGMSLRELPLDQPIDLENYFRPDEYHKVEMEQAEKEYQEFLASPPTEEQLGKEYDERLKEEWDRFEERKRICAELRGRYERMLQQVEEWEPPTSEHQNLKNFMLNQIRMSIESDCMVYEPTPEGKDAFINAYITPEYILDKIEYHSMKWGLEVEYCRKKKEWFSRLVESLQQNRNIFDGEEDLPQMREGTGCR